MRGDLPPQDRVHAPDPSDGRPGRDVAEVSFDLPEEVLGIDVPGDGEAGVGGSVETAKEVLDVLDVGGVEVLRRPDGHPAIRVGRREHRRLEHHVGHSVRAVLIALAALVFHDVPLDVEALLVQGVQEEAHAVRLEPQGQLQIVGRHVLPVVGPVRGGGAVE